MHPAGKVMENYVITIGYVKPVEKCKIIESGSCVSVFIISSALQLVVSLGCVAYQQWSRMYSDGSRFRRGASDGRIKLVVEPLHQEWGQCDPR
jgi:hypothetical protein